MIVSQIFTLNQLILVNTWGLIPYFSPIAFQVVPSVSTNTSCASGISMVVFCVRKPSFESVGRWGFIASRFQRDIWYSPTSCPICCHAFTEMLLCRLILGIGWLSIWCCRAEVGFRGSLGVSVVDVCAKIPPIIPATANPHALTRSHLCIFLFLAISNSFISGLACMSSSVTGKITNLHSFVPLFRQ